ncbi:uncharacterized protein LOC143888949 [Tasmannia lanceolata]|uniref:uncharacterized protein LOC143859708 n=1 Tax=Tasmannia lanceolata TaxID=3420 RepID=UPI00406409F2
MDKLTSYVSDIHGNWDCHANYNFTTKGRIWIVWDRSQIRVNVLHESKQHVHTEVTFIHYNITILLTFVYATNSGNERRLLWDSLDSIAPTNRIPWGISMVLGDFNVIRFAEESVGGAEPNRIEMADFNECIDCCSLHDLKCMGQTLSWSNSPKTSELKLRRLDRALVNDEWINTLIDSFAIYRYDHAPLIIHLAERHNEIKKPFKFFSAWLMDLSIFECVERAWSINSKGNPMFRLSQKLKNTKQAIKIWNQTKFGRVNLIAPSVKQDLEDVQIALASNPTDLHLRSRESSLKERFFKVSRMEESMRRQNAIVQWLNLGDSNFAYFYSVMNARRNQNSIGGLLDVHGNLTTDHSQIENIMISYFQNLLNSGTIVRRLCCPPPPKSFCRRKLIG